MYRHEYPCLILSTSDSGPSHGMRKDLPSRLRAAVSLAPSPGAALRAAAKVLQAGTPQGSVFLMGQNVGKIKVNRWLIDG